MLEDRRASTIGGINVGLTIWESTIESMLFYNSSSWLETSNKTMKVLKNLYHQWYCCLFRIGTGAPKANFFWLCGTRTPENIILEEKMKFYFHLKNLPPNSLGKEIIEAQERNKHLPSLTKELKKI